MKKRLVRFAAAACAAAIMMNAPGAYGTETDKSYNDVNFATYGNLTEGSDIPSLFRNDDVFNNYKDYPPVINDGVEYVPLELFYGLSGVKISYSDDNSNFYIQNKNTNQYISFNVSDSYAVTGQNKVYETEVPTFYGVQYVPLRAVCDTVSIGCSTYNDGENRMYAIEIYTKPDALSAQDLLHIYAPELYSSTEIAPENTPNAGGTVSAEQPTGNGKEEYTPTIPPVYVANDTDIYHDNPANVEDINDRNNGKDNGKPEKEPNNTDKPEKPQTPQKIRGGNIMLFYLPDHFENVEKTLDALDDLGTKAVFFVTEQNILEHPSVIRRIYISGHTIGITFDMSDEKIFDQDVLEQKIESAESALYDVAKLKTRLIYLGEDGKNNVIPDSVRESVEAMGLHPVVLNADAKTDTLNPQKTAESMRSSLMDIHASYGSETVYLKLHHTDSAIAAAGVAAGLAMTNEQIRIELYDEANARARE